MTQWPEWKATWRIAPKNKSNCLDFTLVFYWYQNKGESTVFMGVFELNSDFFRFKVDLCNFSNQDST